MSQLYSEAASTDNHLESATQRRVLLALARRVGDDGLGDLDWPGLETETMMARSNVIDIVMLLLHRGIIVGGPRRGAFRMNIPLIDSVRGVGNEDAMEKGLA
jgi:hypothetical protein